MPRLSPQPARTLPGGRFAWPDALLLAGFLGLGYGLARVFGEWRTPYRAVADIDLSLLAIPHYAALSCTRALVSYAVCLVFALAAGYAAWRNRWVERLLVPALDICQSLTLFAFLPGILLTLLALFPDTNVGLELTSVCLLFTCQAWNLFFSFYYALRSIPKDLSEVSSVYRLSSWRRFTHLQVPAAGLPLVWNSVMSFANGWFFLLVCESFVLGAQDYVLPGLGSYLGAAYRVHDTAAILAALAAMATIVLLLDLLIWRPLVVWAQRFKLEESGADSVATNRVHIWLRGSRFVVPLVLSIGRNIGRPIDRALVRLGLQEASPGSATAEARRVRRVWGGIGAVVGAVAVLATAFGLWRLAGLLWRLPLAAWGDIAVASVLTVSRVVASVLLATLWTVPIGVAIGASPRVARFLQPAMQFLASFPSSMLFPIATVFLLKIGMGLGVGSILLMTLGVQWYVLFNVVSGAMAIPHDLHVAADIYGLRGWRRWRCLILPAIFPHLVAGWVAAAGGAWNATIIAEHCTYGSTVYQTRGLGALITETTIHADFPMLAACALTMALLVVAMNRFFWLKVSALAETRYSLAA